MNVFIYHNKTDPHKGRAAIPMNNLTFLKIRTVTAVGVTTMERKQWVERCAHSRSSVCEEVRVPRGFLGLPYAGQ